MERRITIPAPIRGIDTDTQPEGTSHRCKDLIPWRGGLRKRGAATVEATYLYNSVTELGAPGFLDGHGWIVNFKKTVDNGFIYASENLGTQAGVSLNDFDATENFDGDLMVDRWIPAGEELVGIRQYGTRDIDQCGLVRWAGGTTYDNSPTGTITVTANSRKVTGSGTAFSTECAINDFICVNPAGSTTGRLYHKITKIESDTVMYIDTESEASVSSATWFIMGVVPLIPNPPLTEGSALFGVVWTTGTTTVGREKFANTILTRAACYHQGRLFVANFVEGKYRDTTQGQPNTRDQKYRIRWSALRAESAPSTSLGAADKFRGISYFEDAAVLDLGSVGGEIMGIVSWRTALVVLRQNAVQIITGGFATDGTDLGATVQTVAQGVGCWRSSAWDVGEDGVYFCDAAGAYLWDGQQVRNLTRGRVSQYWDTTYQNSFGSAPEYVSCLRDRVVFSGGADSPEVWVSYWPGYDAWLEFQLDDVYREIPRVVRSLRDDEIMLEYDGTDLVYVNFKTMLEWSSLNADHLRADENGAADGSYPAPRVLLNPVPLADGISPGRVLQVNVNHSGKQDTYGNGSTGNIAIDIFDAPAYESQVVGSSAGTTYLKFPDPNDASSNEATRTASQNPDSVNPTTHAAVQITVAGGSPATASDKRFTYTLWGVGLDVDVDDKYAD